MLLKTDLEIQPKHWEEMGARRCFAIYNEEVSVHGYKMGWIEEQKSVFKKES